MRTIRTLTAPRAAQLAAGALILALPSSAYALTEGAATTRDRLPRPVVRTWPQEIHLSYGRDATVRGAVAGGLGARRDARVPGRRERALARARLDPSGAARRLHAARARAALRPPAGGGDADRPAAWRRSPRRRRSESRRPRRAGRLRSRSQPHFASGPARSTRWRVAPCRSAACCCRPPAAVSSGSCRAPARAGRRSRALPRATTVASSCTSRYRPRRRPGSASTSAATGRTSPPRRPPAGS